MSSPTLLTKEQARLLKKKKAAKRTDKRFKYVNAAVAQAKILGLDKLVFVTMCEFADDDGCLWHGERSLATATGLSQPTVHRCIERLIASGAVVLLHKGKSKWDTNMYRVFAVDTEQQPTIYNVARFHRQQKQRKHKQPRLQLILCESVGGLPDSVGIGKPEELILCESKDIEFDFDPLMFSLRQGNSGRFAPSPAHLQCEDKSQSQNQNRTGSGLRVASKDTLPAADQNHTADETQAESQRSRQRPQFRAFVNVPAGDCEFCLQTTDNHHKNCKLLREAHHA